MIQTLGPVPAPFNHAHADARARLRRTQFLTSHNLQACDSSDANLVKMVRALQQDWTEGRVRPRCTTPKAAITALARLATRYGPSGSRVLGRGPGPGLILYRIESAPCPSLATLHADALNPEELAEIEEFRLGGFDIRIEGESWIARSGVRVLIGNPVDLKLTFEPELDDELRPGRSFPPRHVRLRGNAPGDSVRIPAPQPIESQS